MVDEIWKAIPGYEGYYEVSDQGRVRSLDRQVSAGRGRMRTQKGGPLADARHTHGYRYVSLCRDGKPNVMTLHRIVMLAFEGERPAGKDIRHLNGEKTDNRRVNLSYGTKKENQADRILHGTDCRGSKSKNAKQTEVEVLEIRARYKNGESQRQLAVEFNTTQCNIGSIVRGNSWSHLAFDVIDSHSRLSNKGEKVAWRN